MTIESDLLIDSASGTIEIASELRMSVFRLARRLRTHHLAGAQSFAQMVVLMRLSRHGPATLSALAAAEGITPQSMARTVGNLVDGGMLARSPDPSDGRRILLSLTDKAEQMVHEFQSQRDNWLAATMSARLTPEECALLRVSARLIDRLSAE